MKYLILGLIFLGNPSIIILKESEKKCFILKSEILPNFPNYFQVHLSLGRFFVKKINKNFIIISINKRLNKINKFPYRKIYSMLTKVFRCDTILWLTHVNFTKSKCVCDAAVVTAAAFHNRIFFSKAFTVEAKLRGQA